MRERTRVLLRCRETGIVPANLLGNEHDKQITNSRFRMDIRNSNSMLIMVQLTQYQGKWIKSWIGQIFSGLVRGTWIGRL